MHISSMRQRLPAHHETMAREWALLAPPFTAVSFTPRSRHWCPLSVRRRKWHLFDWQIWSLPVSDRRSGGPAGMNQRTRPPLQPLPFYCRALWTAISSRFSCPDAGVSPPRRFRSGDGVRAHEEAFGAFFPYLVVGCLFSRLRGSMAFAIFPDARCPIRHLVAAASIDFCDTLTFHGHFVDPPRPCPGP